MKFGTTTFMDFFIFKLHLESCKILVNALLNEMPEIPKPAQYYCCSIISHISQLSNFEHISKDDF